MTTPRGDNNHTIVIESNPLRASGHVDDDADVVPPDPTVSPHRRQPVRHTDDEVTGNHVPPRRS